MSNVKEGIKWCGPVGLLYLDGSECDTTPSVQKLSAKCVANLVQPSLGSLVFHSCFDTKVTNVGTS